MPVNAWVSFGLFHSITFYTEWEELGTILRVLWDSRVLRSFPWRDSYSSWILFSWEGYRARELDRRAMLVEYLLCM